MKNFGVLTFLFLLYSFLGVTQNSITIMDIEITTQLTFIEVNRSNKVNFEKALSKLSLLAKEIKLNEDFDWLVYTSHNDNYLFINFSNDTSDVLELNDYRDQFSKAGKLLEFDNIIADLKSCEFKVTKNFLQEMLLPWSTVKEISVEKHPLTTMTEFKIYPKYIDEFDRHTRQLVKLLKETEYPYPLEGNRGSLGAYSSVFHIWFYDDKKQNSIQNHLENWMNSKEKLKEFNALKNTIDTLTFSRKDYKLVYLPKLSY